MRRGGGGGLLADPGRFDPPSPVSAVSAVSARLFTSGCVLSGVNVCVGFTSFDFDSMTIKKWAFILVCFPLCVFLF